MVRPRAKSLFVESSKLEHVESDDDRNPKDSDEWKLHDDIKLLHFINSQIPQGDKLTYKERLEKIDWTKIFIYGHKSHELKERFEQILQKTRTYRLLNEILKDAEKDILRNNVFPKKPVSPYILFIQENRDQIKEKSNGSEFLKTSLKIFNDLTENEKNIYRQKFYDKKKEYNDIVGIYNLDIKKNITPFSVFLEYKKRNDPTAKYADIRSEYSKFDKSSKLKWILKFLKVDDGQKLDLDQYMKARSSLSKEEMAIIDDYEERPKKTNAYNMFLKDFMAMHRGTNVPPRDLFKRVSKEWKNLSREEKGIYNKAGNRSKIEFEKQVEEFIKSLPKDRQQYELENIDKSTGQHKKIGTSENQEKLKEQISTDNDSEDNFIEPNQQQQLQKEANNKKKKKSLTKKKIDNDNATVKTKSIENKKTKKEKHKKNEENNSNNDYNENSIKSPLRIGVFSPEKLKETENYLSQSSNNEHHESDSYKENSKKSNKSSSSNHKRKISTNETSSIRNNLQSTANKSESSSDGSSNDSDNSGKTANKSSLRKKRKISTNEPTPKKRINSESTPSNDILSQDSSSSKIRKISTNEPTPITNNSQSTANKSESSSDGSSTDGDNSGKTPNKSSLCKKRKISTNEPTPMTNNSQSTANKSESSSDGSSTDGDNSGKTPNKSSLRKKRKILTNEPTPKKRINSESTPSNDILSQDSSSSKIRKISTNEPTPMTNNSQSTANKSESSSDGSSTDGDNSGKTPNKSSLRKKRKISTNEPSSKKTRNNSKSTTKTKKQQQQKSNIEEITKHLIKPPNSVYKYYVLNIYRGPMNRAKMSYKSLDAKEKNAIQKKYEKLTAKFLNDFKKCANKLSPEELNELSGFYRTSEDDEISDLTESDNDGSSESEESD